MTEKAARGDGECRAGVTEAGAGLVLCSARYPRRSAGMTEKAARGDGECSVGVTEVGAMGWPCGVVEAGGGGGGLLRDAQVDFLGASGGQVQLHDAVVVGVGDD